MQHGIWIGIDGGGTHSTAVAAWPDGRVAAVTEGGGLNYLHTGIETARRRLGEMVEALCEKAGAPAEKVCAGLAALDGPGDAETAALLAGGPVPPGALDLQSDAYTALMGTTCGEPGMAVICGTGSMLLLLDGNGRQLVSGGWGYLLEDAGSGYSLARHALLAVADAADGVGPETRLTAAALEWFGAARPRQLIDRIYSPDCTPDRFAGFGRFVLELAGAGDAVSREIVDRGMERLARLAAFRLRGSPEVRKTGLYGGIFAHSAPARAAFCRSLRSLVPDAEILDPEFPPELGALIHLLRREGPLRPETLTLLKHTWKEAAP